MIVYHWYRSSGGEHYWRACIEGRPETARHSASCAEAIGLVVMHEGGGTTRREVALDGLFARDFPAHATIQQDDAR